MEFCKCVSNSFPRCFDVSGFVSHTRDKNCLPSCLDIRDRLDSFKFFENDLYVLRSFRSSVVSDSFFDLLADVSHLGLLLPVHILSSVRAKSSWSVLLIVSSLCAAVIVVCCCSASHQPMPRFAFSSSSCAADALLHQSFLLFALPSSKFVCCRSDISAISFAAASCLPVNLFSRSSYHRSISRIFACLH